ncbi:hypothetical protein TREES_T100021852 [Tupaia chinensis]|uniref:Uncharacterized protein n=1 Tax=Tupaia chinensis TaxID=246437 RepID=L9JAV0_TUPCH|nr:hypothetical protein TREES_T100021852 [Tupaia chinensis]
MEAAAAVLAMEREVTQSTSTVFLVRVNSDFTSKDDRSTPGKLWRRSQDSGLCFGAPGHQSQRRLQLLSKPQAALGKAQTSH